MSQPLSPTAPCVRACLSNVPGTWDVRDDPHSYAILVNDWAVTWVNKMSGGWITGDVELMPTPPIEALRAILLGLPFEPGPGRGFNHIDWRKLHFPVST